MSMFDKSEFIRDVFEAKFTSTQGDDFTSMLNLFSSDTEWEEVSSKDVRFLPVSEVDGISEAAMKDSIGGEFPIAMEHGGIVYPIRPFVFKAIKQHHKDAAKILNTMLAKGQYSDVCKHLNMSAPYLTKKLLAMHRGEKLGGYFSQFNHSWDEQQQVEYAELSLESMFPDMAFQSGNINHIYTMVEWMLGQSIEDAGLAGDSAIAQAYVDAWVSAGGDRAEIEEAKPVCRFLTGESGLTAITLSPTLVMKSSTINLGSSLSVTHRGSDDQVWSKFEEFPDRIAVLYQEGLKGLGNLCRRKVFYPYNACSRVLAIFKSAVPAKTLQNILDDFAAFYPPDEKELTCFAIDVYQHINRALETECFNPLRRVQNAELMARLLMSDWSSFDQPTPVAIRATKSIELPMWTLE